MIYPIQRIQNQPDLDKFSKLYEERSGLPIPLEYLRRNTVFGMYKTGELVGGYIISRSKGHDSRTCQSFISKSVQNEKAAILESEVVEVCCFWLKKTRKNYFYKSLLIWSDMAIRMVFNPAKIVLFGTNKMSLASVYAYPRKSLLLAQDSINNRPTWVFYSNKKNFFRGVGEILISRIKLFNKITELWTPQLPIAIAL